VNNGFSTFEAFYLAWEYCETHRHSRSCSGISLVLNLHYMTDGTHLAPVAKAVFIASKAWDWEHGLARQVRPRIKNVLSEDIKVSDTWKLFE